MRPKAFGLFLLLLATASAQGTRTWQQTSFEDFEKGSAHGVAISSRGALTVAPDFQPLAATPSTYLWEVVADDEGNVYAAAGSPARVYKIAPDGRSTVIFAPTELQVQAIALGRDGVYAATSPDGKVYRIEKKPGAAAARNGKTVNSVKVAAAEAKSSDEVAVDPDYSTGVYFDPHTKYIWDLAFDREGALYAATGDQGQIFRISKAGEGSVFFKSDETHIRVLRFDAKGDLIAGSDGTGLVYRITPAGDAFVLFSAPKKEITSLAMDDAGSIFVAATGEKRTPPPAPSPTAASAPSSAPPAAPPAPPSGGNGSDVFQIAADGSPRRIFSTREDIIYTLGFYSPTRLLAGTGNKGKVYAIELDAPGTYADLLKASATQVTSLTRAPGGGLFAATGNLGKVFRIAAAPQTEASYESDVFDAKIFSQWGRAEVRSQGNVEIWMRSGNVENPDRNWSPWKRVASSGPGAGSANIPAARFAQWKAVLRPTAGAVTSVESVLLNYRTKNAAPVIDDVVVQPGMRFIPLPAPPPGAQPPAPAVAMAAPGAKDKDAVGVRWSASDENDDALVFSLYYRGDGETAWKPLTKAPITDRTYSFDAGLLPDGGYVIKVVASDSPAHLPGEALSAERESNRFEVDNTPPLLSAVRASMSGAQIHVNFSAIDSFSPIKRAEYSLDAGDWQFIEPVGRLSDARSEDYDFNVPLPPNKAAGEHVVVVRVYDRYDNMAAAKAVVH